MYYCILIPSEELLNLRSYQLNKKFRQSCFYPFKLKLTSAKVYNLPLMVHNFHHDAHCSASSFTQHYDFLRGQCCISSTMKTESPFVIPQSLFKSHEVARRAAFSPLPAGLARQIRMSIYSMSPCTCIGGLFPDRWLHGPLHHLRRRRRLCRDGVVGGCR